MGEDIRLAARTTVDQATLSVGEDGAICDCDEALEALLRYRSSELGGQHVSVVLLELRRVHPRGQIRPAASVSLPYRSSLSIHGEGWPWLLQRNLPECSARLPFSARSPIVRLA